MGIGRRSVSKHLFLFIWKGHKISNSYWFLSHNNGTWLFSESLSFQHFPFVSEKNKTRVPVESTWNIRLYELKHQHLSVCRPSKTYEKSASISKPQILHHAHQVKCNYLFFLAVSMKCSFGGVINWFWHCHGYNNGFLFFFNPKKRIIHHQEWNSTFFQCFFFQKKLVHSRGS